MWAQYTTGLSTDNHVGNTRRIHTKAEWENQGAVNRAHVLQRSMPLQAASVLPSNPKVGVLIKAATRTPLTLEKLCQ